MEDRDARIAEAESLLADGELGPGFADGLFFGTFPAERLGAYPLAQPSVEVAAQLASLAEYCRAHVDPVKIDREAVIPNAVVAGLGRTGVLGACLPRAFGGGGLSQVDYCRMMEILGGHCGGTALFVNAHHSIGPRALVLFGTPDQQRRYLPQLATGESLSAFALTEPEAGSDAANVQTTATPTSDGTGYRLNGEKRWITNGGIADVLTVMARTPRGSDGRGEITAFIVTPDMAGFEVIEQRMDKCGVRGSATARLAFRDLFVPRENILGERGRGLKIALTVLDFGRVTFGASCTGAARFCVARSTEHVQRRVQFGQALAEFELVRAKLAAMASDTFAMEAMTRQTAAMIDRGGHEFMIETAMLKVFATERLWRIINDTIQLYGGLAYFTDQPFERMMRDARINTIGEGANDVLRVFIALAGMRGVGGELQQVLEALTTTSGKAGKVSAYFGRKLGSWIHPPDVPLRCGDLRDEASALASQTRRFGAAVERALRTYELAILDRQYQLGRISDVASELFASACVLWRLDAESASSDLSDAERLYHRTLGRHFLRRSTRHVAALLHELGDNDDALTTSTAEAVLRQAPPAE
ncbi:MAG: acyl-CoA dehydrogenase family protein [Pirellulales bacterium]